RALNDGQQAALRSLLKRLVPVSAFPRLKTLAPVRAGDLIEGVKVRAERNSATDYIANLDFSFQAKAIRDLLRREGIPFTDEQAPVLSVVPVAVAAGGARADPARANTSNAPDPQPPLPPLQLPPLNPALTRD